MTTTSEQQARIPDSVSAGAEPLPATLARWATLHGDQRAVTFVDYQGDPDGDAVSLTWRELNARADAVAQWCQRHGTRGDRVAMLLGQSVDYVVAFLGVLRSGLVAVPLFEPSPLPGHAERLAAALADCGPSLALTTRVHADAVEGFLAEHAPVMPRLIAVDLLPERASEPYQPASPKPDDLAYLQYTSGSTREPAGVMVTHRNVAAAAAQTVSAYQRTPGSTVVSWLPLFHDMGLMVGIAAPLSGGLSSILMDPIAFLARPQRWLEQMAAASGPAITVAPNFAYGYAASRVTDEDKAKLRLDNVALFGDGSEPVVPSIVDAFYTAFADCGATPRMFRQGYGLAEAVLLVSSSPAGVPPKTRRFDRVRLAAGRAVEVATGTASSSTLVSAGQALDQLVRIIDPETGTVLPDRHVGEIWSSGPNVCKGYWGKEQESVSVFQAEPVDENGQPIDPYPGCAGWLRTGDLGVVVDGDLFITGRLKDLIIVDGRNHYPQDIEYSVEQAHAAIRRHSVAAFSIPSGDGEQAVVVAERARQVAAEEIDHAEVAAAVKAIVSRQHGLALRDVLVIDPGELPRTSSGKIRRSMCRLRYAEGIFNASG